MTDRPKDRDDVRFIPGFRPMAPVEDVDKRPIEGPVVPTTQPETKPGIHQITKTPSRTSLVPTKQK